jgi:hypothetical protein
VPAQVADEYLDVPEFYYPHTVDFRGRAYPLHPSLHHLGEAAVTPPTQRGLHHGRLMKRCFAFRLLQGTILCIACLANAKGR